MKRPELGALNGVIMIGAAFLGTWGCQVLQPWGSHGEDGVLTHESSGPCQLLTPGQPLTGVRLCRSDDGFRVVTPTREYRLSLKMVERKVGDLFTQLDLQWLAPDRVMGYAQAELFLDVGTLTPEDLHFVLRFGKGAGLIQLTLPMAVDHWHVDPDDLAILRDREDMKSIAYRAGMLQLVPQEGVSRERTLDLIQRSGVLNAGGRYETRLEGTWPRLVLRVPLMAEDETISRLARVPRIRESLRDILWIPLPHRAGNRHRIIVVPVTSQGRS